MLDDCLGHYTAQHRPGLHGTSTLQHVDMPRTEGKHSEGKEQYGGAAVNRKKRKAARPHVSTSLDSLEVRMGVWMYEGASSVPARCVLNTLRVCATR